MRALEGLFHAQTRDIKDSIGEQSKRISGVDRTTVKHKRETDNTITRIEKKVGAADTKHAKAIQSSEERLSKLEVGDTRSDAASTTSTARMARMGGPDLARRDMRRGFTMDEGAARGDPELGHGAVRTDKVRSHNENESQTRRCRTSTLDDPEEHQPLQSNITPNVDRYPAVAGERANKTGDASSMRCGQTALADA